jgi:hypothetical protein
MMKHWITTGLCSLVLLGNTIQAQTSNHLNTFDMVEQYRREIRMGNEEVAINALLKARGFADEAAVHPSTSGMSKSWKYRGDVYFLIHKEKSPRLVLDRKGADDSAAASFVRALTVEKKSNGKAKVESPEEIASKLQELINARGNASNEAYEQKKFGVAYQGFNACRQWMRALASPDLFDQKTVDQLNKAVGSYTYMMGLAALQDKARQDRITVAMTHLEEAEKMGFDGIDVYGLMIQTQLDEKNYEAAKTTLARAQKKYADSLSVFFFDVRIALETNDIPRAEGLLKEGKVKFPSAKLDFMIQEVNIYIERNDFPKALQVMNEAIAEANETDLKVQLHVTSGQICEQLMEKSSGEQAADYERQAMDHYRKAIELVPNTATAIAGLGNAHIRKANKLVEQANQLPLSKAKEYDALKKQYMEEFKLAAELLEKSYAVKKTKAVQSNLISIYERLENFDRVEELKKDKI